MSIFRMPQKSLLIHMLRRWVLSLKQYNTHTVGLICSVMVCLVPVTIAEITVVPPWFISFICWFSLYLVQLSRHLYSIVLSILLGTSKFPPFYIKTEYYGICNDNIVEVNFLSYQLSHFMLFHNGLGSIVCSLICLFLAQDTSFEMFRMGLIYCFQDRSWICQWSDIFVI